MKKINVLLAALLSVTVLFGAAVPANAASADVNIEIKATTMDGVSVTVPTQLPILFLLIRNRQIRWCRFPPVVIRRMALKCLNWRAKRDF